MMLSLSSSVPTFVYSIGQNSFLRIERAFVVAWNDKGCKGRVNKVFQRCFLCISLKFLSVSKKFQPYFKEIAAVFYKG